MPERAPYAFVCASERAHARSVLGVRREFGQSEHRGCRSAPRLDEIGASGAARLRRLLRQAARVRSMGHVARHRLRHGRRRRLLLRTRQARARQSRRVHAQPERGFGVPTRARTRESQSERARLA
eukprot:1756944-Pleurochrysis_carterae.AAC.3